ncbi:hypothetical protein ACWDR0_16255 [Streptomyces sp. NPDC003691]
MLPSFWISATTLLLNDKLPEVFAAAGDALWVFTGCTGAAFHTAIQLSVTAWTNRDLVSIGDHDNGIVRFHPGGATRQGTPVGVISSDWRTKKRLG